MKFFKLNFFKNALLTFIIFLFGFSCLGLEQKTSAWSTLPELEDRGNQIISSYHDLICQSIIYENNSTDVLFNFFESLEAENETDKSLLVKATPTDTFINILNPFYSTLVDIFCNYSNYLNRAIIELNQQQISFQETDPQPTQSESSSEQVTGLTLELTDSDWKTYLKKHKEEFTSYWLKENPGLDETSPEFKKAWKKEYGKVYKKMPKYKAYHKAYNKVYYENPKNRATRKAYNKAYKKVYYENPEVKEHTKARKKAYYERKKMEQQISHLTR